MKDVRNYNLLKHNTFGIEAHCRRFVEFDTIEELKELCCSLTSADQPLMVLGGGSNLLLTKDFNGTVIHSAIKGIEAIQETAEDILVRVGSGEVWDDFVAHCVSQGWHGAENLSLIPGEVGASAVQNIGAYGAEAKDIIYKVEAMEITSGKMVELSNADCQYGYRQSLFKTEWKGRYIITHVTYRLSKVFTPRLDYGNIRAELQAEGISSPTPQQLRDVIIKIRREKLPDPQVEGNAGSFFMNPVVSREKYDSLAALYPAMPHYDVDADHVKIPAGWMIDQCGWKGRSLGRAGVHSRQALVLVNRGGATGSEIVNLCTTIRKDVKDKFDIDIHPEVNIV
ncbi:MAG: UDP-N-acetylmuramate dehydrogenase [Prevotella sp.]